MFQISLAVLFIILSVLIRVGPHLPNMAPIVGVGLFCGAYLPRRWAVAVPVLAMALGDLMLGWVPENLFGWIAVALSAALGFLLRKRRPAWTVVGASVIGSTLFFLISNFGVWVLGCGPGWYPPTLQGLAACLTAGVPFYRNGLVGDLVYTAVLFAGYEFFIQWHLRSTTVAALKSP